MECDGEGCESEKLENAVLEIWDRMIFYRREKFQSVSVCAVVNLLPFGQPFRSAEKITRPPGEQFADQKKTENPAGGSDEFLILQEKSNERKSHRECVYAGLSNALGSFVMANVVEGKEIEVGRHLMVG
jgi:hypothetical protein